MAVKLARGDLVFLEVSVADEEKGIANAKLQAEYAPTYVLRDRHVEIADVRRRRTRYFCPCATLSLMLSPAMHLLIVRCEDTAMNKTGSAGERRQKRRQTSFPSLFDERIATGRKSADAFSFSSSSYPVSFVSNRPAGDLLCRQQHSSSVFHLLPEQCGLGNLCEVAASEGAARCSSVGAFLLRRQSRLALPWRASV